MGVYSVSQTDHRPALPLCGSILRVPNQYKYKDCLDTNAINMIRTTVKVLFSDSLAARQLARWIANDFQYKY